ncbi:MAG: hypothetical protein COY53_06220 [Elusimicrobia bacterium CG_4_10_14_0_8_um_filter_37_32]|nr:MAG: hypothetical protein COS17_02675 [Elusimicrobia bacterium CG02_land_8_20_14_3_00_37_13]PIZ13175.1 MAG: hypothetical protein COY53_06220 [Elusimicrobia bacterium CG_4_10_14_0_8_um_filter_37_32]
MCKVLLAAGYRVGIVAQPDTEKDITRLGEPELFWGVTNLIRKYFKNTKPVIIGGIEALKKTY